MIIAVLLAGQALPSIDRASLDLQARAEALQPAPTVRGSARLVRRASTSTLLGLSSITTICRAAGRQSDPSAFVARLGDAYALSGEERHTLRSSCAAYLAGSADARRRAAGH